MHTRLNDEADTSISLQIFRHMLSVEFSAPEANTLTKQLTYIKNKKSQISWNLNIEKRMVEQPSMNFKSVHIVHTSDADSGNLL